MKHLLAALGTAALVACQAGSDGRLLIDFDGGPLNSPPVGKGDGGYDAGTDGGSDGGADAGCTHESFNGTAFNNCPMSGVGQQSVTVVESGCSTFISLGGGLVCTGTYSGVHNAFDGGCGGLDCTATSIPGSIVCDAGTPTTCTIVICDGGTCP